MQLNRTPNNPKQSNPIPPSKTPIILTYIDEDPELTPERWWRRRQQQSLTNL